MDSHPLGIVQAQKRSRTTKGCPVEDQRALRGSRQSWKQCNYGCPWTNGAAVATVVGAQGRHPVLFHGLRTTSILAASESAIENLSLHKMERHSRVGSTLHRHVFVIIHVK